MKHRVLALAAAAAVALSAAVPASAFFFSKQEEAPAVLTVSKNGPVGQGLTFSADDFALEEGSAELGSIVISALPDSGTGVLTLGGQNIQVGDEIALSALSGLCFQSSTQPTELQASFTFIPVSQDGVQGAQTTAEIYLLTEENNAPVARGQSLSTYKNVAITGRLEAVDPEGDLLSYHLVKKPARGQVTLEEDGQFVYTPYEDKAGKDSFTFVAVDTVGNASDPATVKVVIEKASTKLTYADLDGHPAGKAAIRLAEEGIYVGECINGAYFFRPDTQVTRGEFVAMAMQVVELPALEGVERTGFSDDSAIPTWAKPYVSSALKAGLVQGSVGEAGEILFRGESGITAAEAAVILDRALEITDVSAEHFGVDGTPTWAAQSVANLSTCGMLDSQQSMSTAMTRGEAAQLLCSALELLDSRDQGWF